MLARIYGAIKSLLAPSWQLLSDHLTLVQTNVGVQRARHPILKVLLNSFDRRLQRGFKQRDRLNLCRDVFGWRNPVPERREDRHQDTALLQVQSKQSGIREHVGLFVRREHRLVQCCMHAWFVGEPRGCYEKSEVQVGKGKSQLLENRGPPVGLPEVAAAGSRRGFIEASDAFVQSLWNRCVRIPDDDVKRLMQ